jgi:hypothetical protein
MSKFNQFDVEFPKSEDSITLVFNDNFNGGVEASYPYTETLTYDVKYIENYGTVFSKGEEITDDVLKIDIVGTYTVTFTAMAKSQADALIDSDLLDASIDASSSIYHLHTELNLTSTYTSKYYIYQDNSDEDPVQTVSKPEYIITDTYFLSSSYSFNPLYSKTTGYTSFVKIGTNSLAAVIFSEYTTETKYNKSNYTTTAVYDTTEIISEEHSYSFRTVIDNNMLLFALRNIDLGVEESYILNVVSPSFGSTQSIKVVNEEENEAKFKINGNDEETVKFKKYSFVRNVANATGFPQYALIQKEQTTKLENKSLLLEYVATLNPNNSFLCLGGMQYTLKTVA